MTIFETPRMIVRRFAAADADDFFLLNSDASVMHFIRPPKNREQSDAFLQENIGFYLDSSVLGRFAVYDKLSTQFLGTFSFLYLSGDANFHIGYALLPSAWGKGYATELVKAGTPYFFDHTHRDALFAITHPDNLPSQQVLLKSGYRRDGQIEEHGAKLELFVINRAVAP